MSQIPQGEPSVNKQIQLMEIHTADFSAKKLLEVILYRDRLTNNLIYFLDQAIRNQLIDDKHNKQYLRILRYCVTQFAYYQILQANNFRTNPDSNQFVMANQFYKIFEDEDDLKEKVREFQTENDEQAKKIKDEIEKRHKTVLLWRDKVLKDFSNLKKEFNQDSPDQIKFLKLVQWSDKPNQANFDIYSYFFGLFYSEEWFPDYRMCNDIEVLKLQCCCHQFLKLDNVFVIEYYPNQTLQMIEIKEKNNSIEYYRDLLKQKSE